MLKPNIDFYPYQKKAVRFQCERPFTMLWLDMGLGKTAITLTSILHLLRTNKLKGVLIVAPIRVVRLVWEQECKKWEHLKDLKFSSITGTKDQRCRALLKGADIYLTNYENMKWLSETLDTYFLKKGKELPFDGVVWDEVSKMKNSTTQRVKSIRNVLPFFKWATGLTGTPASNGYKDLHGQYLVVDKGERLGRFKTQFKDRFYMKVGDYLEIAREGAEEQIKKLIGDITLEMSAADYNPLPELLINDIHIELTGEVKTQYESLEKEYFFELQNGKEIEVFNKGALTNKCLQFSNGAVYPVVGSSVFETVHELKLDALEDILEEANGKPVLCAYVFKSDAERIMKRFKDYNPINLTGNTSLSFLNDAMEKWEKQECQLMIGHPLSMGHGIDRLQNTGNILVWFGLTWSPDQYNQFNARLRRQGQKNVVICHRILTKDTLEEAQAERVKSKIETEESLKKAIKDYGRKKGYY